MLGGSLEKSGKATSALSQIVVFIYYVAIKVEDHATGRPVPTLQ